MQRRALSGNCVMLVPDLRMAPEIRCPNSFVDMYEVIKHVYENNECYGIDRKRISLGGRSFGAYVALGACMLMAQKNECAMLKALFLSAPVLTDVLITTEE